MKRKCAWRRGALRYLRVQQRANAIVPTRFRRPAKPLQTGRKRSTKKNRIKNLCVAGDGFVTRVKKQLSLTQPNSFVSRFTIQPIENVCRKCFACNVEWVALGYWMLLLVFAARCWLFNTLRTHTIAWRSHANLTFNLYINALQITRQVVTRVHTHIEIKWLTYRTRSQCRHHITQYERCLQTVFTLVLLLLYCVRQICYYYKKIILLNLKFSWYSTNVRCASTPTVCLEFSYFFFLQFFAASDGLCLSIDKLSRLLTIKFGPIAEN